MPGLRVDRRDHPVLGACAGDPPRPVARRPARRLGRRPAPTARRRRPPRRRDPAPSTAASTARASLTSAVTSCVAGAVVVPGDARLARIVVVVAGQLERSRLRGPGGGPGGSSRSTASPCPGSPPRRRAPSSRAPGGSCPRNTPVSAITARTASKIRSGRSLARSLLRHNVNTVGWNPSSSSGRARRRPSSASRSATPRPRPGPTGPPATAAPSPWRSRRPAPTGGPGPTRTDQRTARRGTAADGARPRTRAPTRPAPDGRHNAAASNNFRFGSDVPCIPTSLFDPRRKREHPQPNCSAVS